MHRTLDRPDLARAMQELVTDRPDPEDGPCGRPLTAPEVSPGEAGCATIGG